MRRFGFLTITLIILCTALTASVIAYARANHDGGPLPHANFDTCADFPCFAGITLNSPTRQIFTNLAQRGIHYENELRIIATFDLTVLDISLDETRSYVTEMAGFLQPYNANPPIAEYKLGNFIAQYGSPCKVQRRSNFIVLNYPKFRLIAKLDNKRVSPQSDTLQVRVGNIAFCEDNANTLLWAGFAVASRYDAMNPQLVP